MQESKLQAIPHPPSSRARRPKLDSSMSSPRRSITAAGLRRKENDRWPSAPTGSNCCKSPTRSPARRRSTATSSSPPWRMRSRRRHARATAARPKSAPRSIQRPVRCDCRVCCWWWIRLKTTRRRSRSKRRKSATPPAQVDDYIAEALPPLEYGRIAAQSAKQVIVQKVREAERDRQYQEYKDRIADIVNGIVKRVEYGKVVVDLGRGEAIVRR